MIFDCYTMKRNKTFEINIENIDLNCIDLFNEYSKGLKGELSIEFRTDLILKLKVYNKKELIQELIFKEVESKYNSKKFESSIGSEKVDLLIKNEVLDKTVIYMKNKKLNFIHKDIIKKLLDSFFNMHYDNRNPFIKWIILKNINLTNKELKGSECSLHDNYISGYMCVSNEKMVINVLRTKETISLNFLKCLIEKGEYNLKNNYIELIIHHIDFKKQSIEVLDYFFENNEENSEKLITFLIHSKSIREEIEFSQLLTYLNWRKNNNKLLTFKELNQIICFGSEDISILDEVKNLFKESIQKILNGFEINDYINKIEDKLKQDRSISELEYSYDLSTTLIYILKNIENKKGFILKILNIISNIESGIFSRFEKEILFSKECEKISQHKEQILNYHIKYKLKFRFNMIGLERILENINLEIQYNLIELLTEKSLWINRIYIEMIKEKYYMSLQIESF